MYSPGVEGPSAGECGPGLCAPRCWSPQDAQERVARSELGVRGTRPGRAQPLRWMGHLEGGQWREKGHKFGHSGDTAGWAKPAVEFLAGRRARQTRGSGAPPVPSFPTPGGCGSRERTLPRAAGSGRRLPGAAPTCFAANRQGRLIQSELLKEAAAPPLLASEKASIALSDWTLPVFYRLVVLVWSSAKKWPGTHV